ncbi:unnamed protein product [Sphagnum troendelagicum]|uniref:Uncharacterized protein n=1 Tax=Sphagnum troendelagicum TaxID=128251 RepID=A0ABP0UDQ1_9BRYO
MRPYRKGTPHPSDRHRKCLVPKSSDDDQDRKDSPLHLLQLIQTQIDGLASKVQRVGVSSNMGGSWEVQSFVDSLAEINSILKEWQNLFEMSMDHQQPSNATSMFGEKENLRESVNASSDSIRYHDIDCLRDLPVVFLHANSSSQPPCTELSKSPLTLSCNTTPVATKESTCMWPEVVSSVPASVSQVPDTPYMLSPPKSVRLLLANASSSSSSSFLSTPSNLLSPLLTKVGSRILQTPSTDLLTPIFPPTPHFLLQSPGEFDTCEVFSSPSFKTPGFETSPPRTLQQAKQSFSSESDEYLVTPSVPSPFRTAGVSLRFSLSSGSSSDESSSVMDDFTASTVKRLGPKGLEEKLWHELEIRKADVLKSFNCGQMSLCSRKKSMSTRCCEKGSCRGQEKGAKS